MKKRPLAKGKLKKTIVVAFIIAAQLYLKKNVGKEEFCEKQK